MWSHIGSGSHGRVHREVSDTGTGIYRKNIDQMKVGRSGAKALWSKGLGHVREIQRLRSGRNSDDISSVAVTTQCRSLLVLLRR